MNPLASRRCVPCERGARPLAGRKLATLERELGGSWRVVRGKRLRTTFQFENFVDALAFVNRLGALAEEQQHHPDLKLQWGRVDVELTTHAAGGLTENDFILAAKIDRLARR